MLGVVTLSVVMLSVVILSVIILSVIILSHYTECYYIECLILSVNDSNYRDSVVIQAAMSAREAKHTSLCTPDCNFGSKNGIVKFSRVRVRDSEDLCWFSWAILATWSQFYKTFFLCL